MTSEQIKPENLSPKNIPSRINLEPIEFEEDGSIGFHKDEIDHP